MADMITKTILIVEDEPDTAEMYALMLQKSGFRIIKASGGVAAMKHLLQEKPDLVLLDVMMPDVSGLEVLRFLRREPGLERLPVIIISAKGLPEDVREGMMAGASVYLTKPIEYVELRQVVNEALSKTG